MKPQSACTICCSVFGSVTTKRGKCDQCGNERLVKFKEGRGMCGRTPETSNVKLLFEGEIIIQAHHK